MTICLYSRNLITNITLFCRYGSTKSSTMCNSLASLNATICRTVVKVITPVSSVCFGGHAQLLEQGIICTGAANNVIQKRSYAQIKIKRDKVLPTKPLKFDYSGDLITQKPLDLQEKFYRYSDIKELEDAPDCVVKLCSLQYFDGQDRLRHRKYEMNEKMEAVCGPGFYWEKEVAKMTVVVRNMIPHCLQFRKDKRSKSLLVEKIAMRKKIMKYLRREDYERFIWLLKELKIRYVPSPPYVAKMTRRACLKKEARDAAISLHEKKMNDLKEKFDIEKIKFFEYKAEILKEIEHDIEKYGLNKASVLDSVRQKRATE